MPIRAITLDLDDTLWPFGPVAVRVQAALAAWMAEFAPATAARFGPETARETFLAVREERPDLAHRIADIRREALRRMLTAAGEDPALADAAVALTTETRQRVDLYPEVPAALDRLAARVPLLAVTNGNADLERTGVARWFTGLVSAGELGVAKPAPEIFHAACARLRLAPADVLHAGDDLALDVAGGLAAGMPVAWVHRDLAGDPPPGVLRCRDLTELADAVEAA